MWPFRLWSCLLCKEWNGLSSEIWWEWAIHNVVNPQTDLFATDATRDTHQAQSALNS